MNNVRVRFAPSPTGYLHIGNARTALFNWLFAGKEKGKFILRIEDTDTERSEEKYEHSLIEDLYWLGLAWDEGPDVGGGYGPYEQSARRATYNEYFQILKNKGLVYPCYCTVNELEDRRKLDIAQGKAPRYDNRCRDLTKEKISEYEKEGRKASWRFKVPEKIISFKDMVRGDVSFDTKLFGDFVIIKQDGNPTFHFAVSIDDICMKITHVIRGEDHLSNTPRHILLWESFGEKPPLYGHVPLIVGQSGEPLSKRDGTVSVAEYRKLGYLPEGLLNYLALLGWSSGTKKEIFGPKELVEIFSLNGFSRSPSVFDKEKLDWINSNHIRNMDIDKLTHLCIPYLTEAKLIKQPLDKDILEYLKKIILSVKGNMVVLNQCADYVKIFLHDAILFSGKEAEDIINAAYVPNLFKILRDKLLKIDSMTQEIIKGVFSSAQKEAGIKGKEFYMPIRVAITGMTDGPELIDVLPLLTKEKIIKRLSIK